MVGTGAARHACVGDDHTGCAETRDEIASGIRERRSVADVARVNDDTRGREGRCNARELGFTPREQADGCALRSIMARSGGEWRTYRTPERIDPKIRSEGRALLNSGVRFHA